MGGLFGGLLDLVNVMGGGILYLLIGSKAWKDSKEGRFFRLASGTIGLGLILGVSFYLFVLKRDVDTAEDVVGKVLFSTVFASIACAIFIAVIESVRRKLE